MNRVRLLAFLLTLSPFAALSQEFSKAIEDNSFLIEEAFNQEDRVVQHISTLQYSFESKDLQFSFTQEWPVGSQAHQFSYTVPYLSFSGRGHGMGDILINYRYQLNDEDGGWGHVAPRLSAILPTGKKSDGLGSGTAGLQVNLPISKRWADAFISHFNAGVTTFFHVEGAGPGGSTLKKTLVSYGVGASGIYLMEKDFNLMLELLLNRFAALEAGDVTYNSVFILNPGFRFAIDLGSLQIVPGLAIPLQFAPDSTELGVFAYLSFEHPF